jgi:hypothetical protein
VESNVPFSFIPARPPVLSKKIRIKKILLRCAISRNKSLSSETIGTRKKDTGGGRTILHLDRLNNNAAGPSPWKCLQIHEIHYLPPYPGLLSSGCLKLMKREKRPGEHVCGLLGTPPSRLIPHSFQ